MCISISYQFSSHPCNRIRHKSFAVSLYYIEQQQKAEHAENSKNKIRNFDGVGHFANTLSSYIARLQPTIGHYTKFTHKTENSC